MTDEKHYGGFKYRNRRNKSHLGRNSLLGTVITAIAGTLIKDLTSENSKIKMLFNKVVHPKQIENKQEQRDVLDAEYTVEDNEKTENIIATNKTNSTNEKE